MTRKLVIFFSLIALIVALLFLVPWNSDDKEAPTLHDRLPNADLIGTANVLELSALFSKTGLSAHGGNRASSLYSRLYDHACRPGFV